MVAAAEELRAFGARTVVVKGGHLARAGTGTGAPSPDVVVGPGGSVVLEADRVATGNDHGTGCSLSAAIAANLALGADALEAVRAAKAYVRRALERRRPPGGSGPGTGRSTTSAGRRRRETRPAGRRLERSWRSSPSLPGAATR